MVSSSKHVTKYAQSVFLSSHMSNKSQNSLQFCLDLKKVLDLILSNPGLLFHLQHVCDTGYNLPQLPHLDQIVHERARDKIT